ncbi:4-hydroxy-tetrahydrodipicolinate synthase [Paraburkholderia sp.]|uniref:4-hydroxy-tetrahydrodipicolinate synthase n=1 Tax=Paraburkholderia sp. TaxID=1926495 RepID=UPI003C79883A
MTFTLHGVTTALVTPFTPDDEFDERTFRELIDFQIKSGISGLLVIGGSGEYVSLRPSERQHVVEVAVDQAAGRVPIVVGALSPGTIEVQDVTRFAAKAKADAVLVLPPYYIKTDSTGIYDHFARVADSAEIPIVAYNNVGRTGVNLDVRMLEKLSAIPSIVALKECERDLAIVSAKIDALGDRMAILSGDDDLGFPTFLVGSPGAIFMSSNLLPAFHVKLFDECVRGNIAAAREAHYELITLIQALYTPNHPGPLKDAMRLIGRDVGRARAPLQGASEETLGRVSAMLTRVNNRF